MSSISSRKSLAIISQGPHKAEVELSAGGALNWSFWGRICFKLIQGIGRIQVLVAVGHRSLPPCQLSVRGHSSSLRGHLHSFSRGPSCLQTSDDAPRLSHASDLSSFLFCCHPEELCSVRSIPLGLSLQLSTIVSSTYMMGQQSWG